MGCNTVRLIPLCDCLGGRITQNSTVPHTAVATKEPRSVLLVIGAMPGNASYRAAIARLQETLSNQGVHHVSVGNPDAGCNRGDIYNKAKTLCDAGGKLTTIICSDGCCILQEHCLLLRGTQDEISIVPTSGLVHDLTLALGQTRLNDVCFATGRSDAAVHSAQWLPEDSAALSLAPWNSPNFLDYVHHLSQCAGESDWSLDGLRKAAQAHGTDIVVEATMRRSTGESLRNMSTPRGEFESDRPGYIREDFSGVLGPVFPPMNPQESVRISSEETGGWDGPPPPPYSERDPVHASAQDSSNGEASDAAGPDEQA